MANEVWQDFNSFSVLSIDEELDATSVLVSCNQWPTVWISQRLVIVFDNGYTTAWHGVGIPPVLGFDNELWRQSLEEIATVVETR